MLKNLEFYLSKKGFYRYAEVEKLALSIEAFFQTQLHVQVQLTGNFRRRMEVLEAIDVLIVKPENELLHGAIVAGKLKIESESDNEMHLFTESKVKVILHFCDAEYFDSQLFITTGCNSFVECVQYKLTGKDWSNCKSEEEIFQLAGCHFVEPGLREKYIDEDNMLYNKLI